MSDIFLFDTNFYYKVAGVMLMLCPVVFIALQHVTAGYGMMYSKKWGPSVGNRAGWIMMEAPAFLAMLALWLLSARRWDPAPMVMCLLFLIHYFHRSFIFPLRMRGNSRMPLAIVLMGMTFNVVNAYLIGAWLFYVSPAERYPASWLTSPLFLLGIVVFIAGMAINMHSDNVIRHLRKPGDTRHYIPRGGMFRFVTSANYLGEFVEWTGYAILTWSLGGLIFALWTFANLAPRARRIHERYLREFGKEYSCLGRRYILPFLY